MRIDPLGQIQELTQALAQEQRMRRRCGEHCAALEREVTRLRVLLHELLDDAPAVLPDGDGAIVPRRDRAAYAAALDRARAVLESPTPLPSPPRAPGR